ncbi:MAG: putative Diguanylate cyclase/phosphodiesterase [Frankiales bacterium]|jgi:diguanylate cyclase (GGDEF)-like protein|nr:putative Diguanylate cyclase/phosphodiesterase [Frankiales bacterium]
MTARMSTPGGPTGARRVGLVGLSLLLAGIGAELTSYAASNWTPGHLPLTVPWWVLLPVYTLALQRPLAYELMHQSRFTTFTHLPMAMGLVFVAPWWHLAARVGAAVVDVTKRRQPPVKALYNICLAFVEIGVASATVAALTRSSQPKPLLWAALMAAMLLTDIVASLAITCVFSLIGVPRAAVEVVKGTMADLATTAVFTSLGILAVAAAWTDPGTLAIIVVLALCLGLGYRRSRRLGEEAQQQSDVQQFLKGLGPLELSSSENADVLEHVRVLLHACELELCLRAGDSWHALHASDSVDGVVTVPLASPPQVAPYDGAVLGQDDHISTPLMHAGELTGLLTVRQRMGNVRPFALRDVRIVETVASELAKALERGQLQRDLALAATTDPLTQLPNLNETCRRMDLLLADPSTELVVAAVAVDSFREVNDTLGHEVGDELLIEVTRRIRISHSDALVGRIGGGRFAIVVPAAKVGGDAAMFGLGIRAQVEGGAQLGPVGTHIRLSVGCVTAPDHGSDAATLIRRAETAMFGARNAHGGPVVWEPVYEVEGHRRLAVVMALREALSSGAIGVAFQPKLSADASRVTGVEALARWTHPALGAISPSEFVPLAEAAGLMGPLTSSVLRQALTACKGWQRRAGRVGVAVNVSADTILDPAFVTEVAAILTSINIAPDLLTLELTEGVVVNDPILAKQRLAEMRALGVKISVDDFGTGYSSLTYLKGLPVDEVKIDKGFVDEIAHEAGDRAVVRAVVDIAHTLGLKVVAEGVEHVDQGLLLADLGVDEVQGYLHARPMAALDMAQWLRRRDEARLDGAPAPRRQY